MTAGQAARAEAGLWSRLAAEWQPSRHRHLWDDVPPEEAAVVRFFDPSDDLAERGSAWGHRFPSVGLADLARFAAGLAETEADAWEHGQPHVATRAFEDRRFLLGDRIVHWAVPWLDSVGRCYPEHRDAALRDRDALLLLADEHRPAPDLTGTEGIVPPGCDGFGPVEIASREIGLSLWSGALLLRATIRSLLADPAAERSDLAAKADAGDLAVFYEVAAGRWRSTAAAHPGSARLWLDLADRAEATARRLTQPIETSSTSKVRA